MHVYRHASLPAAGMIANRHTQEYLHGYEQEISNVVVVDNKVPQVLVPDHKLVV